MIAVAIGAESAMTKPAQFCTQWLMGNMSEEQFILGRDSIIKVLGNLPINSDAMMFVVDQSSHQVINETFPQWKDELFNLKYTEYRTGSVISADMMTNNLLKCFPSGYEALRPKLPQISIIFTIPDTQISGTFDKKHKKSFVVLLDGVKNSDPTVWLPMATNGHHVFNQTTDNAALLDLLAEGMYLPKAQFVLLPISTMYI